MRRPLVVVPQFFGALVFDRRMSRYLPFDVECTELLRALARSGIRRVMSEAPLDRRETLAGFHAYFEAKGWFTLDGFLAAEVLDVTPPVDHLLGPLATHVEVIGACNLACTHCFAAPLPRQKDPLSLAELDRLFGELAALGSFRLGLTGGEPLMRPDFFEVLDAATARGLHPCLTTNGLFVTKAIALELGRRPLVWLNVSLDGATAATNDAVRGAGVFDRVMESLALLREHARFTLAFTVTRDSAEEVEACAQLARDTGAHTAVFRPLYPVGAARSKPEMMPRFSQYSDALVRLSRAHTWEREERSEPEASGATGNRSEAGTGAHLSAPAPERARWTDPFSPHARVETQAKVHANLGCGAGNTVASVSVRGDVNPCSFLGSLFDAGNIRERSFAEIWSSSPGFTRMRELSRRRREGRFEGGCRARSLAASGDVDAPDPWFVEWAAGTAGVAEPGFNAEAEGRRGEG